MEKYKLNGEIVDVSLEEEEQFKLDNPEAEKVSGVEVEESTTETQEEGSEEYIPQTRRKDTEEYEPQTQRKDIEEYKPQTQQGITEKNIEVEDSKDIEVEDGKDVEVEGNEDIEVEDQIKETDLSQDNQENKDNQNLSAIGTEERKAEYDEKGWAYDDTIPGFESSAEVEDIKGAGTEEDTLDISSQASTTTDDLDIVAQGLYQPGIDSPEEILKTNITKVGYHIGDVTVEEWNAMSEADKNQIPGWKDLPVEEKNKFEKKFSFKTPINIDTEKNKIGHYDWDDETFWMREDWDHKENYIESFFDPIMDDYEIEHIGGGFWLFEDMGKKRGGVSSYSKMVITHKDSKERHVINENDWDNSNQGGALVNFLDKTLSEENKIALNKRQDTSARLYKHISQEYVDISSSDKNKYKKVANSIDFEEVLKIEDTKSAIGTKITTKYANDTFIDEDGNYIIDIDFDAFEVDNLKDYWHQAYNSMEEYVDFFSGRYRSSEDRDKFEEELRGIKENYGLTEVHINNMLETFDQIDWTAYQPATATTRGFGENPFYENEGFRNPNYKPVPDGADFKLTQQDRASQLVYDAIVKEKEDKNLQSYMDSIDDAEALKVDALYKYGSQVALNKAISKVEANQKELEKISDETFEVYRGEEKIAIKDITSEIDNFETNLEKEAEEFDPDYGTDILDANGVIHGVGDTEEEIKLDGEKKYNAEIEKILKDSQIEINGDILDNSQEGYDIGYKKILDNYTETTEEEYEDKFNEIQNMVSNGKISHKEGEKQWETYRNDLIEQEEKLKTDLESYDTNFKAQSENQYNLVKAFEKDQEERREKANNEIENFNEELEDFVVIDGKKVLKSSWEKYVANKEVLNETYKYAVKLEDDTFELIGTLGKEEHRVNLINKNYDDWEKFQYNITSTAKWLVLDASYASIKFVAWGLNQDDSKLSKRADNNYYNFKKAEEKLREQYQPDIEFGKAFDSWSNFGKFFVQETGTQMPIMLTLMTGGTGLTILGGSGFTENWSRLVKLEIENPDVEYSTAYKLKTSLAYGAAELVENILTYAGVTRAFKAFTAANKTRLATGWSAAGKEMIRQSAASSPYIALDVLGEGLTTWIQNKIAGRPEFENMDHAMFSAGMFSSMFQLFPIIKGGVMTNFSDSKTLGEYRGNLKLIQELESKLLTKKGEINKRLSKETIKSLETQIADLAGNNEKILNGELDKINNMSKEFVQTFFHYSNQGQLLKLEYDRIKNDKTIDQATRNTLLNGLETKFQQNEIVLKMLKTDPAFGEKFFGFENSTNKEDIKRRDDIFEQAKSELVTEGRTDPSDATIRERARVIYNTQEILTDLSNTKKSGLAKNFESYNTVQEAVDAINKMDISEADKTILIEGVKNGNHGATVTTIDGKEIPFQVVENMAKDSRLETRTHEKSHFVLKELFGENPKAFNDISNEIIKHLQKNDPSNYLKLMTRVSGYNTDVKAEEVVTNFMEMVAEGGIDTKSEQNKHLPSILGFGFNKILSNRTNGKINIDLQGQKDAVNFITQLGKKIKNGTITFRQTKKGKSIIDKETGRVLGKDIKKKYKKFKQEQSKAFKFSSPAQALNDIVPKSANTKAKFNKWVHSKEGSEAIADLFYSENGIVRNTILKNANYNEDQANKTIFEVVKRIFGKTGFNPEATRADGSKVGAKAFGEFVMAGYSKDRIGSIRKMFEEGKFGPKRDISGDLVIGESGRTIFEKSEAEGGLSPEDLMVIKEETAADKKKTQETLTKVFGIDEKLITQFEGALTTAFGTKLPEVNSKQMRNELGKIISDRLRPIIQKKLGTELQFNEFIKNDLTPLLKFIKAEDLRQIERMVGGKKYPDGRKIFTRSKRITRKQEIIDLQNKGLIPKTFTKYAQGYNLATRLPNPTPQELLAFFRGTNAETVLDYQPPGSIKSGMLGARKDKLAELLTREIAFDQAIQVAKNVLPKIKAIESLQNRNIKENYITELGATLDRDPDIGGVNTDNSSVKFSENVSGEIVLEQYDLLANSKNGLIKKFGIENVIDENGNFLLIGPNENMSAVAIDQALKAYNSDIIEDAIGKKFKQGIYKSNKFTEEIKQALRDQGSLSRNETAKQNLHEAASVLTKRLGPKIVDITGYDIFGYYSRLLDSAKLKDDGSMGDWHLDLEALKVDVSNSRDLELPEGISLNDVALMNVAFPLFNKIIKIQNGDYGLTRKAKLKKLKELAPEIERANIANIALGKVIAKEIITLARKGKVFDKKTGKQIGISMIDAINLLQLQTSAIKGFRALTRLDYIHLEDGPQSKYKYTNKKGEIKYTNDAKRKVGKVVVEHEINTDNPQYKNVIEYEKNRGVIKPRDGSTFEQEVVREKLTPGGEHMTPNANTMFEISELIPQSDITGDALDTQLDLIFNDHTQYLTNKHFMDLLDLKSGGKNSMAKHDRINALNQSDLNNIVGPNGESVQTVKEARAFSNLQIKTIETANAKFSKSSAMYQAKDNLIKFSKKPVTKGMSTFDFDDTLARTKSGIRYTIPNNTGKPMPGKKVIFLAGSAGSGKSNVVKQLGLEKQGFKMVNQDISLEWLAKNSGLPTDMRDFTPEQASKWGSLQWEARDIAQRKATKFRGRGDGVVVDGTGASTISMFTQAQKYKDAGYDVQMLFVESSLETALERNKARKERSLQDFIVERNWKAVQKNKKAFKEEFGSNFAEVKTDKLKQGDPMPKSLVNKMDKFTNSYIKGRLTAEEFANKGGSLLDQGAKFDFSEFNKVVDGTPGPLLNKARNRAKKYGTKDMFVLTARPQQSAFAIQQFLKGQGLDIPIKNITGLANSTGDAKAQWMLDKFAEGYNDMYFVDDAIQNVKAVREVLDQLDVKSEVVQAKVKFSKNASRDFNTIIEQSKGVKADVIISQAEAMKTGKNKGWWRLFVPPSAEDFKGLLYRFLGTGKQGEQHMEWFKENLLDPFAKGIRSWNTYKQGMVNEWKQLKKDFKSVHKSLYKNVAGTKFTTDAAIRVYLWDKAGFEIPGLDTETKNKLISYVKGNTKVKQYADTLSKITRTKEGYIQPKEGWSVGTIASDLNDIVTKVGRKQFLQDWIENKNAIFTPDNMNKIEALYGTNFKKALDNILYRMENGTNRRLSPDSNVNALLDWINGSVGAIMFFNMRSATLQTMSTVNFINWNDNNIFKAGKAFANQPRFWKDFATLFNSPQLKQRRKGIQTDVSAAELSSTFADGKASPRKVINYLLQLGFTPTQLVDSFAIAFGGASFYRNRFNTYKKQGMTNKQANDKAMLDFQEIAEETQQSSREDMVSQQQASPLGRIVLAFQNTTMQYTRLTKKSLSDLVNRRGDPKTHVSKIVYYGAVQSIVFLALQQALAQSLWGDDEAEKDKDLKRVFNGALESFLSGTGIHGKIVSTIKNTIGTYQEEKAKPKWKRENANVLLEVLSFSPPIGSKLRKIWQALQAEYYDDGGKLSEELGFRIESPKLYFWSSIIEAALNIPLQRLVRKANNIEEAITSQHSLLNRIMLGMGWSVWDLGIEDEDTVKAKERVAEKKEIEKEKEKEEKKIEKEKQKEEEKKREEEEKKAKGIKTVRCSGIRSNGERCGNTTETAEKTWKCYHHMDFTDGDDRDGDGIKEYRCTAIKKNGDRCKNKTENESKKCYAHQ